MFSVTFDEFFSRLDRENVHKAKVPSSNVVKMTRRNIEMFLYQLFDGNEYKKNDVPQLSSEHFFDCLSVLDDHLDWLIVRMTDDYFNSVFRPKHHGNKTVKDVNESKPIRLISKKKFLSEYSLLNFSHCLFNWNLPAASAGSENNMISNMMKKSGGYLSNVTVPMFMFERYITNIIIGYELFKRGDKETARIVLLSIGKWLNKLDDSNDEFYLSISDGLKHVLISTFVRMNKSNFNRQNKWLLKIIVPFSDLNHQSKAAVSAIRAAVLIEYENNEDHFMKAIECVNIACDLNPTNYYWFYLNSLVLTAHRYFSQSNKSNPTENEKSAMQKAVELCDNDQNIYVKYREVELFRDEVYYNFHTNKNTKDAYSKYICECQKIVQMIKIIINMDTKDSLILINCTRILMNLPAVVHDLNSGKELLLKAVQLTPNDLTVLKAVTQVIILCKRNIENKNTVLLTQNSSSDRLSGANKRGNCFEDLKIAREKHNKGEDPVPYLKSKLFTYNCLTQWKIVSQICSYFVLFSDNLKTGVEYFVLLVEADQNKMINKDLILCHYSSFICKSKKFNLAELISNEILIALVNNALPNKQYYYNMLAKMLLLYGVDMTGTVDISMRCKLIGEQSIENTVPQQNLFKDEDKQSESDRNDHNSNTRKRSRSRSRQRKNNAVNVHNNTHANWDNIGDVKDDNVEDDNVKDDYVEDDNIEDNDGEVSVSSSHTNTNNCCTCRIM